MYQKNHSSPAAIQKALYWLHNQNENWSKYIKDSNTVVKMYQKSHKKESQTSQFQKNLQNFCESNFGADLQKQSSSALSPPPNNCDSTFGASLQKQSSSALSPPPNNCDNAPDISIKKERRDSYENFKSLLTGQILSPDLKNTKLPEKTKLKTQKDSKNTRPNNTKLQNHKESSVIPKSVESFAGTPITIDSKNLQVLEEVKKEWNLKNNEEALNLLIQAGIKKLNQL